MLSVSLVVFLTFASARADDPAPVNVPKDVVEAVQQVLPKGWSASAKGDTLTVRREKLVGVYNPIGLPPGPIERVDPEAYELCLRFRPHVTRDQYATMHNENDAIDAELKSMREAMRAAKIPHKFDEWFPENPGQKQMVAAYRVAQRAMPFHRLPDLYTATHSIDCEDSLGPVRLIADEAVAKECAKVKATVYRLFKAYGTGER